MGSIDELIAGAPHLACAVATLAPVERELFYDGLDSVNATCRSGRDSLVVLAEVYAAEARREGHDRLSELWSDVARTARASSRGRRAPA